MHVGWLRRLCLLSGVVLAVGSTALPWGERAPDAAPLGALYVANSNRRVNAFELYIGRLRVGWLVTAAAMVAGVAALATASQPMPTKGRMSVGVLCGGVHIGLALVHAGPFAGVGLCAGAGVLEWIGGTCHTVPEVTR
jgi:hypothetical protein